MTEPEPRIEHPPLKLRSHRRVLFPDMVEIRWPRRRRKAPKAEKPPKRPKPATPSKPPRPERPAAAATPLVPELVQQSAPAAVPTAPRAALEDYRPLYWRLLRLHHIRPNGWLRALFVEGSVALGVVLVLAEAASSWTIVVLPIVVAVLVKANDVVAGAVRGPTAANERAAAGRSD